MSEAETLPFLSKSINIKETTLMARPLTSIVDIGMTEYCSENKLIEISNLLNSLITKFDDINKRIDNLEKHILEIKDRVTAYEVDPFFDEPSQI
jgi:hypothetical protein